MGDRRVGELMTPRQEIAWIDLNDTIDTIRDTLRQSKHSRFPVADGDLDRLQGFVHVKDLLDESLAGKPLDIRSVLRKAPAVLEPSELCLQSRPCVHKTVTLLLW